MCSVLEFTEIAQCCYLTTQEILGDFVIDGRKVNFFDSYFMSSVVIVITEIDIASTALAQQLVMADAVRFVDGAYLWLHLFCNQMLM